MADDELPKLVRDRIPEAIRGDGKEPVTEHLAADEVEPYLAEKLVEEAEEFRESGAVEELADVLEVIRRHLQLAGTSWEELKALQEEKRAERGGFDDGIVLRDIED